MVLGLIYGMVDHTYFFDLLILYGVMAAKFAVMFAVTWAISRAFREKMKPREKVEQKVTDATQSTVWGVGLRRRFCKMFSESSPCLLGQHSICSTAQRPVELSENILQNLFHNLMPQTVDTSTVRLCTCIASPHTHAR